MCVCVGGGGGGGGEERDSNGVGKTIFSSFGAWTKRYTKYKSYM